MNKNTGIVISVNESKIRIIKINNEDYISLTDLARHKNKNNPSDVIKKWLSNYDTIEFLGLWEELSNNNFNLAEFRQIKIESPKKSFTMSPSQWCKRVKAIYYDTSDTPLGQEPITYNVYSDVNSKNKIDSKEYMNDNITAGVITVEDYKKEKSLALF